MIFLFKRSKYKSKNPLSKILLKNVTFLTKSLSLFIFQTFLFISSEWKFTEYTNFRF